MANELLEETLKFHGHLCPGIAFGYRAAIKALELLGLEEKSIGETHTVIAENDVCGLDAIQFVAGCTIGNDSLIIENEGKQAFSFVHKKTGKGVRILLKAPLWKSSEPLRLHKLVKTGLATPEEKEQFFSARTQRGRELLAMNDDELLWVSEVEKELPKKPRLFPAVTCAACGEQVMEAYIQEVNGKHLCLACSKRDRA